VKQYFASFGETKTIHFVTDPAGHDDALLAAARQTNRPHRRVLTLADAE
jgi:hypothetical protein